MISNTIDYKYRSRYEKRKQLVGSNIALLFGVFNKAIIPLALVGYEIVIANSVLRASLAIYHLISNARS